MKFSQLQEAVNNALFADAAAKRLKYGSFSERNPALGKMVRCPLCRRRRRLNSQIPCCAGTEGLPRIKFETAGSAPPVSKRKNPRLTRKNPPLFLVHQLLVEIEAGTRPELENVAEKNLARYVEKIVVDAKKKKARQKRNQQRLSREINREC